MQERQRENDLEKEIRSVENWAKTKLDLMLTDRDPTYEELRAHYERFNVIRVAEEEGPPDMPFSHA